MMPWVITRLSIAILIAALVARSMTRAWQAGREGRGLLGRLGRIALVTLAVAASGFMASMSIMAVVTARWLLLFEPALAPTLAVTFIGVLMVLFAPLMATIGGALQRRLDKRSG